MKLLAEFPHVRYVWIEDGKGKPLGREIALRSSFGRRWCFCATEEVARAA